MKPPLTLIVARQAGFCFGVTRVIKLISEALERAAEDGQTIFGLGWPIHNTRLVHELEEKGLKIINDIGEIANPQKALLVIRAHGEQRPVLERALAAGIKLLDATCPLVARIRERAAAESAEGRRVICIGSAGHPEVQGILS